MRPLLVTSLAALAVLIVGCGGSSRHVALSAKAWDTPFVTVKPIRNEDPHAAAHQRASGRAAWSQAAYGQMPVSIDPAALAAEMEAAPAMGAETGMSASAQEAAASQAVVADETAVPQPAPAAPVSAPLAAMVATPAAPASAPPTVTMTAPVVQSVLPSAPREAWYDGVHVDLMARSDWAGQDDTRQLSPR